MWRPALAGPSKQGRDFSPGLFFWQARRRLPTPRSYTRQVVTKGAVTSAIIVGLAFATPHAVGHAQDRPSTNSDPIAIAIMRVDGLLIPMVTLRDAASSNLNVVEPSETRSVMAPEARELERRPWQLWKRSGGAPVDVRVTGRATADAGYFFHEAWTTTFTGTPVPPYYVPVAKVGLATQGVVVEQPENVVSQPDAASRRVGRLISHLAHTKESAMVKADPHHPLGGLAAAVRANTVVRLTKLWRRSAGDSETYYFEAVKQVTQHGYLPPILTTGWIILSAGRATSRDVTSLPSDDVHKQAVRRRVLGIVPYRGRDLWVMETQHYEGEDHTVRVWPSGKCGWTEDSEC